MSDKSSWEVVADILDDLQSFVIAEQGSIARDIIKKAAQLIANKCGASLFPIRNLQFSIIYQRYGDPSLSVELEHGRPIAETLALKVSALSSYQDRIEKVVRTGEVDRAASQYLIVPMRLDPKVRAIDGQDLPPRRVVGAFLLESDADYVFQEKDARLFDRFSDGVAVLIQLGESKARSKLTNELHHEYLGNIGKFKSEFEIFRKLLDSLTNKEVNYFSETSEITILLYHSFYKDQLYLACENGILDSDFRQKNAYDYNSDKMIELFGECKADIFDKKKSDITMFSTAKYRSNIVVPILVHHDNRIGYLLLRTKQVNAYQDGQNFLQRTADFLAATLRSFRHDSWEKNFTDFFKKYINNNIEYTDSELYVAMADVLKKVYGNVALAVVGFHKKTRGLEFTPLNRESNEVEDWGESILNELKNYINTPNIEPFPSGSKQYYIYPIKTESGLPVNFILVKMTRDSIASTHQFIQQMLEMIRDKLSFLRKKKRLDALTDFANTITNEKDLTQERAYDLVDTYTKRVMTTTNMYIALLDKETRMITFDLFKRFNKETGRREHWQVEPRKFDPDSKIIPRTEYILKTKDMILINTKEESDQWYKKHGDSEQLGDSFASWIGVPIMSSGEAIGVIAVYHPTDEYLYNKEGDGVFLKNIAAHFSSLLVRVDMEKSMHREQLLRDAAKQEEEWVKAFIFKQLKEKTSDIIFDLEQTTALTIKDIEIYRKRENISNFFEDAFIMQNEASHFIAEIKKNIESMSMSSKKENIDFSYLIRSILDSLDAFTYIVETNKSKERRIDIFAKYDDYFIVLFSLLKSVIGFVKDRKIQIKYEIIKGSKSISINFIFNNNDIHGDWLDNIISVPNIIGERRLKAKINFENHILIWQSPLEHQETVLIVGGALATKRTLESTLSSLEIKSQYADKIFESELLRVIFLLDSEKKDINYQGKAKVISVETIKDFDDINFPYSKIEKTKLSNKNYIENLLKAVGYYD